jgi:hypothetical protein
MTDWVTFLSDLPSGLGSQIIYRTSMIYVDCSAGPSPVTQSDLVISKEPSLVRYSIRDSNTEYLNPD